MSKRKVFLVTSNDPWEVVALGFAGENLARTVEWDIGPWVETYGEGEVQLLAKRPVDKNPYPVVVTRDGNSVLWTVRKEDLWYGNELGQAQLFYLMDGQVVARSKAFRTMTREAIEGDVQECSEPERDWVEQVLQSVASAEESANDAADSALLAAESAEMAQAYSGKPPVITDDIWYVWDAESDAYLSTGKPSRGEQGLTGPQGVTGPKGETGEAAGFGVPVATVDNSVGVPEVTVSASGPDTAKVFSFAFSGIKGETGAQGPQGAKGEPGAGVGSVVRTAGNGAAGTTDTYTMYNDEGEVIGSFEVYNGKDGKGNEDFLILTTSGDVISVDDSAGGKMKGLHLYGRSVQDGIPTPDNPVEIESAGDKGNITVTLSNGGEKYQTLTYPTPNGLPGIPVDSGGNYTDENGQEWICDEVDYERGKYVKRVKKIDYNGSSDESWSTQSTNASDVYRFYINPGDSKAYDITAIGNILCNRFQAVRSDTLGTYGRHQGVSIDSGGRILIYSEEINDTIENWVSWLSSNPISVIYELAYPIESDISSELLAVYAALATYKPSTIITTDSSPSAGIEVKYVADTETYIKRINSALKDLQAQVDILIGAESKTTWPD